MNNLPTRADIDTDLEAHATLRSYDLALESPGHTRLVEDLQAIGGSINM
jgi:hypothetical protein